LHLKLEIYRYTVNEPFLTSLHHTINKFSKSSLTQENDGGKMGIKLKRLWFNITIDLQHPNSHKYTYTSHHELHTNHSALLFFTIKLNGFNFG